MSNSFFQFKQFLVNQDKTAMKVSTDACIQGAWTPVKNEAGNVLDIGTGTGLLSLMLAQRYSNIKIDAIDIDERAAEQAKANIKVSPWKDRIEVLHGDIRNMELKKHYDLIICNPPFFHNDLLGDKHQRNVARHSITLTPWQLLEIIAKYLKSDGYASVMFPATEHIAWEKALAEINWHITHRLSIRPTVDMKPNRVVSLCSPQQILEIQDAELVIYDNNKYTTQFMNLLSPFYLKL